MTPKIETPKKLEQKVEVFKKLDSRKSYRKIAEEFRCSIRNISKINRENHEAFILNQPLAKKRFVIKKHLILTLMFSCSDFFLS